jgi:hypothetical protein
MAPKPAAALAPGSTLQVSPQVSALVGWLRQAPLPPAVE